jgi:tetratricopeptide (TPR) repeat protein
MSKIAHTNQVTDRAIPATADHRRIFARKNPHIILRHVLIGMLTLAVAGACPAVAHAQSTLPMSATELFDAALIHVEQGSLKLAAEEFARAYELEPHAATRLNLARVRNRMGDYREAIVDFEHWLSATEKSGPELQAKRLQVERELETARSHVGYVDLIEAPAEYEFRVNGYLANSRSFLAINPGTTSVEVTSPACARESKSVELQAGQRFVWKGTVTCPKARRAGATPHSLAAMQLAPTDVQAGFGYSAALPSSNTRHGSATDSPIGYDTWRYAGIGTAILGLATLGSSIYLAHNTWIDNRIAGGEERARDKGEVLSNVTWGLIAATAVGASTTLTLFLLKPEPTLAKAHSLRINVGAAAARLELVGTF